MWFSDVKYTRDYEYEGGERSLELARRKPFEVSEGCFRRMMGLEFTEQGLQGGMDERT